MIGGLKCWLWGHQWKLVEREPGEPHPWVVVYCPRCHYERQGQDTKEQFTDGDLGNRVTID